jgi:hypothetical protein
MSILQAAGRAFSSRERTGNVATQNYELTNLGKQKAENAAFGGDTALVVAVLQEKQCPCTIRELARETSLDEGKVSAIITGLRRQNPPLALPARQGGT